jgi:hypothetical protein
MLTVNLRGVERGRGGVQHCLTQFDVDWVGSANGNLRERERDKERERAREAYKVWWR